MDGYAKRLLTSGVILAVALVGCSKPLAWPPSPLYDFPAGNSPQAKPLDREAALKAIAGHYAHYDVVAYEDSTTKTPMRSFVISYGFTDFDLRDGKLVETDRFCRAVQKINQRNVASYFNDAAVQAIKPRVAEVDLRLEGGRWRVFRPETPTLLGIAGDPAQPLSKDPKDPNLIDPDGDGHPGVTVRLDIGRVINGEIYITRREIYSTRLVLNDDGSLTGDVVDRSEQFVVDASLPILRQKSASVQVADPGLNPIMLVRVDPSIDTAEELMANRDRLFPPEPEFPGSK